jgi:Inhibitor of growth proteins N-terminal histone-binding
LCIELIDEREKLKRELLRKHAGESAEEEEKRIKKQYGDLQALYERIDSLAEEKIEITEKLFLMQENFIRKLD